MASMTLDQHQWCIPGDIVVLVSLFVPPVILTVTKRSGQKRVRFSGVRCEQFLHTSSTGSRNVPCGHA